MTRAQRLFVLFSFVAVVGVAFAGIRINPSVRTELRNCLDNGNTASKVVVNGSYLMRITDEDTWLCWSSTCTDAGGERFPVNTVMLMDFNGGDGGVELSCHSTTDGGDAIFTQAWAQ